MFLALALAALNQDKRLRPSPMFRAQENSPTKTVGYEYILRVTMRQQQEQFRGISGEVVAPTKEVVAAPVSSPASVSSSTGGTLPGSSVAPALSFELGSADGGFTYDARLRFAPRSSGMRAKKRPDTHSELASGGKSPGATWTAADGGLRQPSSLSDGDEA